MLHPPLAEEGTHAVGEGHVPVLLTLRAWFFAVGITRACHSTSYAGPPLPRERKGSENLEQPGRALTTADAHRHHGIFRAAALAFD